MAVRVIDNFIRPYQVKELQNAFLGSHFPWYFNGDTTQEGDGMFKYTHRLDRVETEPSAYLVFLHPIFDELSADKFYRINANSLHRTRFFNRSTGYHIDNYPCSKTAIFYVNTNNGYTKFEGGGKVKSVANRMVIFDSTLEHAGFTCTDEKRRVVINFNYE